MTQKGEDLRVRRTRKLLREALISLIEQEQRSFDSLTVGEIAARAMVSRAAFYRYYQDKYNLVEQIFAETIKTMIARMEQLRQQMIHDNPSLPPESSPQLYLTYEEISPAPWVSIFEHVAEYKHLYRALLGENGSSWFRKKMRNFLVSMLLERGEEMVFHQDAPPLARQRVFQEGFVPMLLIGHLLDAISWWLEHDLPYPPAQIAGYCHRLIIVSLREVNTWE